ncbi:MAG: hypothetical protein IT536_10095 [Hyphomicrobiales bacterium]|nr:hypothetical protein [Hyphomicrobiales bacterium]
MTGRRTRFTITPSAMVAGLALGLVATPAIATDFYAGKQIQMRIGAAAGGGYDFYGRLVARHLGRHIPGTPTIVTSNMPGAGARKLASYLFSMAARDGTEIGALSPNSIVGPLIDSNLRDRYDPRQFHYIGTVDTGVRVCITWGPSPTKTFADAQQRKTILGATSSGGAPRDFAVFLNAVAGAKFEIVTGYKGTDEILLAMEKGEVEGICGFEWVSLISQKPDWIRDRAINILVQMAFDASEEISRLGVPTIWKYLEGEDDRRIMEFLVSEQQFQRPFVLPPGTPKERVDILRAAFDAMIEDASFVAATKKFGLNITPAPGAAVQAMVDKLYATPANLVERSEAIRTGGAKKR